MPGAARALRPGRAAAADLARATGAGEGACAAFFAAAARVAVATAPRRAARPAAGVAASGAPATPAALAAPAAAGADGAAAFFPRPQRPKRPPRSGAAASIILHSSSVSIFGSRSLGILAFFFLSVMYGP